MKGLPFFDRPADRVDAGLPLRLSVVAEVPPYDKKALELSDKVDVLLDGTVLPEVAMWDVFEGMVMRKRRNPDGGAVIERGLPTYETLRGRVEVRFRRAEGSGNG